MKIRILSDTHLKDGSLPENITALIQTDAAGRPDMVIHAGDFSSEEAYSAFRELCGGQDIPLHAVCGNCDPAPLARMLPERLILEEEGFRIGVVHEAGRSLDDHTARWYLLREMDVDILVFGHIHFPVIASFAGKYLLCPGSPARPRLSGPTAMELEIENGRVNDIRLMPLGPPMCASIRFCDALAEKENREKKT